jgi:hypothetical protein
LNAEEARITHGNSVWQLETSWKRNYVMLSRWKVRMEGDEGLKKAQEDEASVDQAVHSSRRIQRWHHQYPKLPCRVSSKLTRDRESAFVGKKLKPGRRRKWIVFYA